MIEQRVINELRVKYPLETNRYQYLGWHMYSLTVNGERVNVIAIEYNIEGYYWLQLFLWDKTGINWLDQIQFDINTVWADVRRLAKERINQHFPQ